MGDKCYTGPIEPIGDCMYRIPKSYKAGMLVDGIIFADEELIPQIVADQAPDQVANVAHLPGIQKASLAMPDIHWGYGFSIGGVAATDPDEGGVISPGGVGYDINCGVRAVRTNLHAEELGDCLPELATALFNGIPAGVGQAGPYSFKGKDMRKLLCQGVKYLAKQGLATEQDVAHTEANGRMVGTDPDAMSEKAIKRGEPQCGTLGAGNHFVEVQVVDRIDDEQAAKAMGLEVGQICVMIHSGSRGLGYQVCEDSLRLLRKVPEKYGISVPDRQLACAPVNSSEGDQYYAMMCGAANYAWANRQLLMVQVREVFAQFFGRKWEELGMELIYDVAHNIAKMEEHEVDGVMKTLCVHRKGATRAFPAGHPETPEAYQEIGQPVIIPGDMGTSSWILTGQPGSMERSFGSSCHGAGRVMSRTAAIRHAKGRRIDQELAEAGIIAKCRHWKGLAEEQPDAYKDVDKIVDIVDRAGLARRAVRLRPMAVVKG